MDAESNQQAWVAGADGCRASWFVVLRAVDTGALRRRVVEDVEALLALPEVPAVIGVDIIIGLPEAPRRGGRECDKQARRLLDGPRARSVFSPPAQAALAGTSYDEALAINRACSPDGVGLSKQTYHLFPKLRAVDRHMTPDRQDRVHEVHPELSFLAMNGGAALSESKHAAAGRRARRQLLAANGFSGIEDGPHDHTGRGVRPDDILDAHAACWTAARIAAGTAARLPPGEPPRNARGLRMEIWR